MFAFYKEIPYQHPHLIFENFSKQQGAVLLESAQLRPGCGRYSFMAVNPFLTLMSKNGDIYLNDIKSVGNPWVVLSNKLKNFSLQCHKNLPPFQGGVVGFFGYDLYQHLESIRSSQVDDMEFPDMAVGFYDLVVGFDHEVEKAWIFSSGYPEKEGREKRAEERCAWLLENMKKNSEKNRYESEAIEIEANFTRDEYSEAVKKVKNSILDGDIFEANISQRFSAEFFGDAFSLYQQLQVCNPAPFSAYLHFGATVLASASPERFLKLVESDVESRPIKGTRPRGLAAEEDMQLAQSLMNSEKDVAENVMIVDLLRNDLSRVCENHSVQVPQLCGLESYATVHHLVSVVTGKLKEKYHAVDLLRVSFPGGSITGAPKIRAMEIIAEVEKTKRGPYCGSIAYIGFNGDMDSSIVIRTFAIKNNKLTFQAGGAITMDSDPDEEYEETLTKAKALRKVLHDFVN